jgi:hypothetical protein
MVDFEVCVLSFRRMTCGLILLKIFSFILSEIFFPRFEVLTAVNMSIVSYGL